MNLEEYNALGNAINSTWGKSSTANSQSNSISVKAQLLGDNGEDPDKTQLLLTYNCVISFGDVTDREREMDREQRDSESVLDAAVKKIKEDFKESAGRTLKTKQISDDTDWTLLSLGQYSGRRDALFQRKVMLEVG